MSIKILGFGQCGSKIGIEVSASFNPASVLEGTGPIRATFRAFFEYFRPSTLDQIKCPQIYIADLNADNDVYMQYRKMEAIRTQLEANNKLTTSDIIARVNESNTTVDLHEDDGRLVEQVRSNRPALAMIRALYFSTPNDQILQTGGVGGLQHISEMIADQDDRLLNSIDASGSAPVVGIFSLGGGTGSGSLYSVLTRYREKHHSYTVGIGVLPERNVEYQQINAGRYITKFLSASPRHRFDTLLLFSNDVATRLLQQSEIQSGAEPQAIMNEYVASFVHALSLITDKGTTTLGGKLFDPIDSRRFLSDICTVGYATSSDKFSAKEMFISAISPMSYSKGSITGVAVSVSSTSDQDRLPDIGEMIVEVTDGLERGRVEARVVERLQAEGAFYRTTKAVHVFFFLNSRKQYAEVFKFSRVIVNFFSAVAGAGVSTDVCSYFVDTLQKSCVLVLFSGSFCYEIYASVLTFVSERFILDDEGRHYFHNEYSNVLSEVGGATQRERDDGLAERVDNLLDEVCDSKRRSKEMLVKTPDFLDQESMRSVLQNRRPKMVTRSAVRSALVDIARRFKAKAKRLPLDEYPFPYERGGETRRLGGFKDQIWMSEDFDKEDEELVAAIERSSIFPKRD